MKNHYEIVILVHPDRSDQVATITQKYRDMIAEEKGLVHRFEDWGRKQLAYPINNVRKAHYILMNIECSVELLNELKSLFKFNDAILRSLVLAKQGAITTPSPMMADKTPASRQGSEKESY